MTEPDFFGVCMMYSYKVYRAYVIAFYRNSKKYDRIEVY